MFKMSKVMLLCYVIIVTVCPWCWWSRHLACLQSMRWTAIEISVVAHVRLCHTNLTIFSFNLMSWFALALPIKILKHNEGLTEFQKFFILHHGVYFKNFPSIVITTRSPLGSSFLLTSILQSMADIIPSPQSSCVIALMLGPYTSTTSCSLFTVGSFGFCTFGWALDGISCKSEIYSSLWPIPTIFRIFSASSAEKGCWPKIAINIK